MSGFAAAHANELLTAADAARILGLSSDMVRLLARGGRLPVAAESVRGLRMFRKADVESLAAERAGHRVHHHIAQFYEEPSFLQSVAANFLDAGLNSRGTVLVIATRERQAALLEQLSSAGHDLKKAQASRVLVVVDAHEALERLMVNGTPHAKRFRRYLGPLIERSRTSHNRFHVYGELVDILCQDGFVEAAVRVEELWNELAENCRLSRLCAYSMDGFRKSDDAELFERVCALHTQVAPTERYVDSADPNQRLRQIALLEQKARALRNEMEMRRCAEHALDQLKSAHAALQSPPEQIEEAL